MQDIYNQQKATSAGASSFETNKVLRNTYSLLAMTLMFSAVTAGISMAVDINFMASMVCSIGALLLIWFVLPRTVVFLSYSPLQVY